MMPDTMPELQMFFHCVTCVEESGKKPYKQELVVGLETPEQVVIGCTKHDTVITTIQTDKFSSSKCDCC